MPENNHAMNNIHILIIYMMPNKGKIYDQICTHLLDQHQPLLLLRDRPEEKSCRVSEVHRSSQRGKASNVDHFVSIWLSYLAITKECSSLLFNLSKTC